MAARTHTSQRSGIWQTAHVASPRPPGVPFVENNCLVSTNPITGVEVGRFQVATPQLVARAVDLARPAAAWWAELGFSGRRQRLARVVSLLTHRTGELAALIHEENGKPVGDATLEVVGAVQHLAWSIRNARRVLRTRRSWAALRMEHTLSIEHQPYGVVGVIGPWNYPVFTPLGSIGSALAAGNAVVFKPSEYTPAVGAYLADLFAQAIPDWPVLTAVHGLGETGAALCRSGVGKIAFTGSTATGRLVLAACADTLTPTLLECGGKDAMIVAGDADVEAAAEACCWGSMTNAGQACVGIERAYVADPVFDAFLAALVRNAAAVRAGFAEEADIGPITMPAQIDIIRSQVTDALSRGARAVAGGPEAIQPPFVLPTVLVDVPDDATIMQEETFGPVLTVHRVRDAEEGLRRSNSTAYGLGGSVFSRSSHGMVIARRMRSGMTAVNGVMSFVGSSPLPFGGIGRSGSGRVHGAAGLREFSWTKVITRRRFRSLIVTESFGRPPGSVRWADRCSRLLHGRGR
ncbi:MAG: aldehyde dehydrogenase family protein [Micromonosporaceae bacterium]|nr:aldehyde dehydrogenase family protein [Micromonosporaceae bacterium]